MVRVQRHRASNFTEWIRRGTIAGDMAETELDIWLPPEPARHSLSRHQRPNGLLREVEYWRSVGAAWGPEGTRGDGRREATR